jgi:hypothetical protein
MKTSVPIYLEERDGEVLAHPLFDHALRVTANLDCALQRRGLAACPKPDGLGGR